MSVFIESEFRPALPVRHEVLWPNERVAFCRVAEHDAGECGNTARLRKLATKTAGQGQGAGSVVLRFLIVHLRSRGVRLFWFDARESAIIFYERFDFVVESERLYKRGVPYFRMVQDL